MNDSSEYLLTLPNPLDHNHEANNGEGGGLQQILIDGQLKGFQKALEPFTLLHENHLRIGGVDLKRVVGRVGGLPSSATEPTVWSRKMFSPSV